MERCLATVRFEPITQRERLRLEKTVPARPVNALMQGRVRVVEALRIGSL